MVMPTSQEDIIQQAATTKSPGSPAPGKIAAGIFRAYDIRGLYGSELNQESVTLISRAIGTEALESGIDCLLVGFDGRLSSPELSKYLLEGILSTGCNVINLGLIPTPLLYFATHTLNCGSGVMLTASHNPANYNGLKIVFRQSCLAPNQLQAIRKRVDEGRFANGAGAESFFDIKDQYIEKVARDIKLARKLKVVVDCGNAVTGIIAPQFFEALGFDVVPLFCEVDGSFPNHHPDPTVVSNLEQLTQAVKTEKADIGIAFDGDGDRLGIITNLGHFVDADQMLMLLAKDIIPKYPGKPIIFDVKCSSRLIQTIQTCGGVPVMNRSGHSFMKQRMQETNAPLGGEFAAHIFIKDRWFGFDDGLYTAARLLEILSQSSQSVDTQFARLPSAFTTPEIKIFVNDDEKFELMERIIELAQFSDASISYLDGIRADFGDGWGLIRASNTTPALLLRFEAESAERLLALKSEFKALLLTADKTLVLDF